MTHNFLSTDFKPVMLNGKPHLSMVQRSNLSSEDTIIADGIVLDANYNVVKRVNITEDFDLHEFSASDNMETFLRVSKKLTVLADLHPQGEMTFLDTCATEVDAHGSVLFSFCPSDKLGYNATYVPLPLADQLDFTYWDP